jgi:hypothetical protein
VYRPARTMNAMAGIKNQSGKRMWPFADVSLETATLWGEAANITLLVCLLGGVLATFVIVRTTNVKEHHWDAARDKSAREIAELTKQGDQLRKDTADANERAAEASQKAAEATLELTKLKTPRILSQEQREKMKACLSGGPTGRMFIRPSMLDSDGPAFAKQLEEVFKEAGFDVAQWPEGPSLGWSRAGIFLIVHRMTDVPPHITAVQRCLFAAGIEALGDPDPKHPEDAVSIGIGPRI